MWWSNKNRIGKENKMVNFSILICILALRSKPVYTYRVSFNYVGTMIFFILSAGGK